MFWGSILFIVISYLPNATLWPIGLWFVLNLGPNGHMITPGADGRIKQNYTLSQDPQELSILHTPTWLGTLGLSACAGPLPIDIATVLNMEFLTNHVPGS